MVVVAEAERAYGLGRSRRGHSSALTADLCALLPRKQSLVCLAQAESSLATEDPRAAELCRIFNVSESSVFINSKPISKNVEVRALALERNHDKWGALLRLLSNVSGLTVVYTRHGNESIKIAQRLRASGFDATALLGLTLKERDIVAKRGAATDGCDAVEAIKHDIVVTDYKVSIMNVQNMRQAIIYSVPVNPIGLERQMRVIGLDGKPGTCLVFLTAEEILESTQKTISREPSLHDVRAMIAQLYAGDVRKLRIGESFPVSIDLWTIRFDVGIQGIHYGVFRCLEQQRYLRPNGSSIVARVRYQNLPEGRRITNMRWNDALNRVTAQRLPTEANGRRAPDNEGIVEEPAGLGVKLWQQMLDGWHKEGPTPELPTSVVFHHALERDPPDENETELIARAIYSQFRRESQAVIDRRLQLLNLFEKKRCIVDGLYVRGNLPQIPQLPALLGQGSS